MYMYVFNFVLVVFCIYCGALDLLIMFFYCTTDYDPVKQREVCVYVCILLHVFIQIKFDNEKYSYLYAYTHIYTHTHTHLAWMCPSLDSRPPKGDVLLPHGRPS